MLPLSARALSILCLAGVLSCVPGWSTAQSGDSPPAITVQGSAAVSAKPDTAQLRIGIVTHDPSAARAIGENNESMSKLLNALHDRGIPKTDIHTSSLTLSPQYRRDSGRRIPHIVGYNARHVLQVTVRQLELVGVLLDEAVRLGANRIDGVTFSVDDPAMHEDRARRHAIADAHRKAALYARATGVTVGRVLAVTETPGAVPMPRQDLMRAGASMPVEPGEIEFRVVVTVKYGIEESR